MLPPIDGHNEERGEQEAAIGQKRSRAVFEQGGTQSPSRLFYPVGHNSEPTKRQNSGEHHPVVDAFNTSGEPA